MLKTKNCNVCGKSATILQRSSGRSLCKSCFIKAYIAQLEDIKNGEESNETCRERTDHTAG